MASRWSWPIAAVAAVAVAVAGLAWLAGGGPDAETASGVPGTASAGAPSGGSRVADEAAPPAAGNVSAPEDTVPAVPPEAVEEALGLDLAGWQRIQEGLVALGFDPGEPNGQVGGGTRRAVRAYQEGAGKLATGFLDETDVTALRYAASEADRLAEQHAGGSGGRGGTAASGRSGRGRASALGGVASPRPCFP